MRPEDQMQPVVQQQVMAQQTIKPAYREQTVQVDAERGEGMAAAALGDLYPTDDKQYKELLSWAQSAFQVAESARRPYEDKWSRYYKMYRSWRGDRKAGDWRSRVFIPMVFTHIETIAPRLVSNLPRPVCFPFGPEDVAPAKAMEQMLDHAATNAKLYLEMVKMAKAALKYGTGIGKTFYKQKTARARRMVPQTQPIYQQVQSPVMGPEGMPMTDMDGNPLSETKEELIGEIPMGMKPERYTYLSYDGPACEAVDVFNFWVAPEAEDMESARYVIHRVYRPYAYVMKRVEEGIYHWPEGLTVDDFFRDTDDPSSMRKSSIGLGGGSGDDTRKDIELLEIWTNDGRVLTMANRKCLIRHAENPYDHGEKPFVRVVDYLQEHEFWGMGEVEAIEGMQDLMNALVNQRIDNVRLVMDRMFAVNETNLVDLDDLIARPGGVIRTRGDVPPNEIVQPLDMGDVTSSAFTEAEQTKRVAEEVTAVSSYQTGMDSPAQQDTATGASLMSEAGLARFGLKTRIMELTAWQKIMEHFGSILQQFTTQERLIRILGPDGQFLFPSFDPAALQGRLDYQIETASVTQTETVRKEQAMALINLAGSLFPPDQMTGLPNPVMLELWKDVLESFGRKDVSRLLPVEPPPPPPPPQMPLPEGATLQDLAQMPPELAEAGGAPEQMPPEQMNGQPV